MRLIFVVIDNAVAAYGSTRTADFYICIKRDPLGLRRFASRGRSGIDRWRLVEVELSRETLEHFLVANGGAQLLVFLDACAQVLQRARLKQLSHAVQDCALYDRRCSSFF